MAINKKVSIKNAVFDAMQILGVEDRISLIPMFKSWATKAEKDIIGPGLMVHAEKKQIVKQIQNCCVDLCCEALSIVLVRKGDWGCECNEQTDRAIFWYYQYYAAMPVEDPRNYVVDSSGTRVISNLTYAVQNNKMVFTGGSFTDGDDVTITMLTLPVDAEGYPLVMEGHDIAIMFFLQWMWSLRSSHKGFGKNYSMSEIRYFQQEWLRYNKAAYADDARLEPHEAAELAWHVNNAYSGAVNSFCRIQPYTW